MNTKLNFLMVLALLAMLVGGNVTPAQAAEGDLDPTFGTGGVLAANTSAVIGGLFSQHTTTQQSDGKIIVGGSFKPAIAVDVWPQAELARYSADGVLDVDFGTGGKIDPQAPGATTSYVVGVYTGPQDEIIAVGGYGVDYGSPSRIYLARYDSAGEPVAGFGTGGVLSVALPYDLDAMIPWSGALQNDGKVLISGEYSIPNEYGGSFLMRLNLADGTLDSTFSNDGMVMSSYPYYASQQIMLQSDGKILVTYAATDTYSLLIHRFTSTGEPDTTFGTDGVLTLPASTQIQCSMLAEGPGGKLYLTAGPADPLNSDFYLARLTATGALDTGFGVNGIVTTDLTGGLDQSCSLLIQADGKVIVGGVAVDVDYNSWSALARYTADGTLDESFGSVGKVITTILPSLTTELDMTPGGKLLATGVTLDYITFATVLARYDLSLPEPGLKIGGTIFKDIDQDEVFDAEEPLAGLDWTINLDHGCDGTIDQTTVSSGAYEFTNLPEGLCYRLSEVAKDFWTQTTVLTDITSLSQDITNMDIGNYPRFWIAADTPKGDIDVPYSHQYSTQGGGTEPFTYALVENEYGQTSILPAGLTLSESGLLSGTPTEGGMFPLGVQATDANGAVSVIDHPVLIIALEGNFTLTSSSNPSLQGEAVTFTLAATGDLIYPELGVVPPVGYVTFLDGETPIEGCTQVLLNLLLNENGQAVGFGDYPATCTTTALGIGTHTITAAFSDPGMHWYKDATCTLEQVVNPANSADLRITKVDSKDPVKPGANLVYTLTVKNLGPNTAQTLTLVDTLDRNTTYVSVSAPRGWTCTYSNGKVTCTSASLTNGSSAIIKITVTVNRTARVGRELVNNASVSSTTYDPDLLNNSVVQKTMVSK